MPRICEKCEKEAECYAYGRYANDWGGWYCMPHVPDGFMIEMVKKAKPCSCERIDSISVGYVPSDECFGCEDD